MKVPMPKRTVQPISQTMTAKVNPAAMSNDGSVEMIGSINNSIQRGLADVQRFAMQIKEAEDRAALSTAERQRDEVMYRAIESAENDPDPQNHAAILADAKKQISAFTPKTRYIADAYTRSTNDRLALFEYRVNRITNQHRIADIKAQMQINLEAAIKHEDYDQLDNIAADMVSAGIWTKTQAVAQLQTAKRQIDYNNAASATIDNAQYMVDTLSSKEWKKDYPNLTAEDRDKLLRNAEQRRDYNQRKQAEQLEEQREIDRDTVFDAINSGELLTYDQLEALSLDEREKQRYWEIIEERNKDKSHLKYQLSDPVLKADISRKIALGEPVTKQEIYSYVGEGLSIADAEKYSAELEKSPRMSPEVKIRKKMGLDKLKEIFEKGQGSDKHWGEPGTEETIAIYARRVQQLEDFWEKYPDASAKQAGDFMGLLTEDIYNDPLFWFNSYDDKKLAQVESKIASTLAAAKVKNAIDSNKKYAPEENFVKGQKITLNGKEYTYSGDGKWEYSE